MTRPMTILLAFVLSTVSLAALSQVPAHDAHHAGAPHNTAVAPPEGELWPTDEPLRTGMSRIQVAVEQAATAQPISRERAQDLARIVEQNVTYIVQHCKLPPKPDAALHVLIARMMTAANHLKEDVSSDAAVAELLSVLQDYRGSFNHSDAASPHRH